MSVDGRLGSSFRDPSGFLFRRDGVLYRQVNQSYQKDFEQLISSGLYDRLTKKGLLIPHQNVQVAPEEPASAFAVLRPEEIPFISYPYEWCFGQLKDAALTTLTIQKEALACGMSLKDASAYNIQFFHGKPLLADTLSFMAYQEGEPWIAYRQFCQHFLAPLALMALTDPRLNRLMTLFIDGIPLDLASRLLPGRTRWNLGLGTHIHLHANAQKRYAGQSIDRSKHRGGMSRLAFQGLIESLETTVRGLKWEPQGTIWADYYGSTNYSKRAFESKMALVEKALEKVHPASVWDLGANTGVFSRLASGKGIPTLAFDYDVGAVELAYREACYRGDSHLLPLVLDFTNPSPPIGWRNRERAALQERGQAGMVMALALVHHMAIGNNVPLDSLASAFAELGPWLLVEFVPKSDAQVQRMLATRTDIFVDYTREGFEAAFSRFYSIVEKSPVEDSERIIYLMARK